LKNSKWRPEPTQKNGATPKSQTIRIIKFSKMKTLAFISGALFSSLTVLGVLFKIQHWPGAAQLLVFGLAGLALIFIPSFAKYKYDKDK